MSDQLEIEDFDTAKAVFEKLKDVPAERRKRILTWIAEGFGVELNAASPPGSPLNPAPPMPHLPGTPATHTPGNPISQRADIKTFVSAKAPKSDQQFATVVAYFYRFESLPAMKKDSINGDILQEAARLAGRKRMSNPRVTLNNAKAAGYLDSNTPGEFTINSVGENLVAMTLPGTNSAPTKKA
jgi:hypothetical protein